MKKKWLSVLLSICLSAGMLAGCGKGDKVPEGEPIEKPTLLTHVYKGADLELSEEYYVQDYTYFHQVG